MSVTGDAVRAPSPPGGRFRRGAGERPPGPWSTWPPLMRAALRYARPYWPLVLVSGLMIIVGAALGLLGPWPFAILVDSVMGEKPLPSILPDAVGSLDRTTLLVGLVVGGLVLTALDNGVAILNEYVTTRLDQSMVLDLRSDLFRHVHRLSPSFYEGERTGMLLYQVNSLAGAVGAVVVALPPVLQSVVTLVGMFVIAFTIAPTLALLSLTVVPVIYASLGYYARRVEPKLIETRRLEGESLTIVHETINMLRVIVAFGRETFTYRRFRAQGEQAVRARVGVTVRQTAFSLVVNTTTAAGSALVVGFGAWQVVHARLTVGELLVLTGYIAAIYKPLEQLSGTVSALQEQFVGLRSVMKLLAVEPAVREAEHPVEIGRADGRLEFEGVGFSYPGRKDTITDVSFSVAAGERIAVVGPTGAGKTTLVWLIARFYDPTSGRILLDGVDIREIGLRSLRRQMSIVLQEPLLFSDSIDRNIRYGNLDATSKEVVEAARAANAHDFIRGLPSGYRTVLGERGARLSGGERQRIAIARAFLRDAPILILDEPTSSIDSRTETSILDALDRLSEGRTTFVIAHRLSTIRRCDRILVVNGGRIVEVGTHDELVRERGLYHQLWIAQTGGGGRERNAPLEDARVAAAALVDAVRHLLAAGTTDLGLLARDAVSEDVAAAAALLAGLTPEQLDALRDLDRGSLSDLIGAATRPPAIEAAAA